MSDQYPHSITIGIVAGEISGDMLGADFMQQMNAIHPNIHWVGVGGNQMTKLGLHSIIDMTRLSVMGLSEVIKHLPDLLKAKSQILAEFKQQNIDIFVGIDAPDFNLRLGKTLKKQGVFCVQYVSPSIWAWRENRIHTIKSATDLVLCLFPFELAVYAKHHHPAVCVGHPLLKKIKPHYDTDTLKATLSPYLDNTTLAHSPLLCVMAGSRTSEIQAMLPTLLSSLALLSDDLQDFIAILPVVSHEHQTLANQLIDKHAPALKDKLYVIYEHEQFHAHDNLSLSQTVMAMADLTVLASGTATLEALLLHARMVVVYKVSPITFAIAKRLIKIPYVALPNILSYDQHQVAIVPELLQDNANPDTIAKTLTDVHQSQQKNELIKLSTLIRSLSQTNPASAVLQAYDNNT